MEKDLTVGNPQTVLWQFCLPLFGSIVFQQLYNIADSLVAGKLIGENALAAVGNSYEITLIFIAFAFGCNVGCSVVVSQLFGAKRIGSMKTAIHTALISAAVVCAVLMAGGLVLGRTLLAAIQTPADILADSALYLDIYIYGLPFVFFYNISTGIFSALGDSKTPFWFLACSSTANILVDVLFVTAFDMGIAGVAWATFLCQGVSCVLAVTVVFHRLHRMTAQEPVQVFSWPLFKRLAVVAVPSILQQSFISVGNILIQSVINSFGTGVMAGYSAAVKLNNLMVTSFTTIGNGMSNYTAQNIGAGKMDRVRAGFTAGVKLIWTLCVPLVLLYFFAGGSLVRFFINDPSPVSISTGIVFLRILSPFYFIVSTKLIADGVLRGASLMGRFMVATFTDLTLRVVLAYILSGLLKDSLGIWCAWPIGWTIATCISLWFYFHGPWRKPAAAEKTAQR